MAEDKQSGVGIPVELGAHSYRIVPQRTGYLKRKLGAFVGGLEEWSNADIEGAGDLWSLLEDRAYELLAILIPDLMPRWEFEGFASQTAADEDQYDEEADRSPTMPQIKTAFVSALQVNDFDWLKHLKNFIGPDLLRAQIRAFLANWTQEQMQSRSSPSLPTPPLTNGESDQTTSGTNGQTSATPQPTGSVSPTSD